MQENLNFLMMKRSGNTTYAPDKQQVNRHLKTGIAIHNLNHSY